MRSFTRAAIQLAGRVAFSRHSIDETALAFANSSDGPVAYIEAEIFGGAGTQANALYSNGRLAQPIAKSSEAINDALRWLGVKVQGNRDEFDTLGLGRHRSTDRWLS